MTPANLATFATTLGALAHPTRLDIIFILSELESLSAADLQHEVEISKQDLSRHLKVLTEARLVIRTGARHHYRYALTSHTAPHLLKALAADLMP